MVITTRQEGTDVIKNEQTIYYWGSDKLYSLSPEDPFRHLSYFFHKNITTIFWLVYKLYEDSECVTHPWVPVSNQLTNKKRAFRDMFDESVNKGDFSSGSWRTDRILIGGNGRELKSREGDQKLELLSWLFQHNDFLIFYSRIYSIYRQTYPWHLRPAPSFLVFLLQFSWHGFSRPRTLPFPSRTVSSSGCQHRSAHTKRPLRLVESNLGLE